jgi:hypothetical protein
MSAIKNKIKVCNKNKVKWLHHNNNNTRYYYEEFSPKCKKGKFLDIEDGDSATICLDGRQLNTIEKILKAVKQIKIKA